MKEVFESRPELKNIPTNARNEVFYNKNFINLLINL
jgi:hypothetical protein